MDQYDPAFESAPHSEIHRCITDEEYLAVYAAAPEEDVTSPEPRRRETCRPRLSA
jgi:uncharacterized Fe-S radical SAM superfamily protein PflX